MTRPTRRLGAGGLPRLLGLLGLLGLLVAAPLAPSYADGSASIDHVQPGPNGTLKLLVSVPSTATVDLNSVAVTLDGTNAPATAVNASSTNDISRTTVLAIDTSLSMAGARITEARKAALSYLDSVPANVAVGIVSFDRQARTVLEPTTDRAQARAALGGLRLARATALYDGVAKALQVGGNSADGQREILVLSDGRDTTTTSLPELVTSIKASGTKVDVVSLQKGDRANAPLNALATAGGGQVLSAADPTALTAAFATEASALSRQVQVTVEVPASQQSTNANLALTMTAAGQSYTNSAFVTVRAHDALAHAKPPTPVGSSALTVPPLAMYGGLGALLIGLLTLAAVSLSPKRATVTSSLEEQMASYGTHAARSTSADDQAGLSIAVQAREAAAKALANNQTLEAKIAGRLEAAGMALKPAEWVLLHGGIAIGAGILGLLLSGGSAIATFFLLVLGAVGPWIYLGLKRARRVKAFDAGLADTLQLMSGSLSAGLSLQQSIDTIVREGGEPIRSEFKRVLVETRLGVQLEDALEGIADRMDSRDFTWVVMAIRIQREVGGNLAELLLQVAATLREREYLRRHVRALSAEGRLSCYILGGLPPVFLLYLVLTKPDYVRPMFHSPLGFVLIAAMSLLLAVGIFWMAKVAKVEV